jgi:hypothetical protein
MKKARTHKNPLPKFGLVIGIIVGMALVTQAERLVQNVHIRSLADLNVANSASVINSIGAAHAAADAYEIKNLLPDHTGPIDSNPIFSWDPIEGVSDYRVLLGTYRGGLNVGYVDTGETTMAAFTGLPAGQPVYLRLIYTVFGKDIQLDVEYRVKN